MDSKRVVLPGHCWPTTHLNTILKGLGNIAVGWMETKWYVETHTAADC